MVYIILCLPLLTPMRTYTDLKDMDLMTKVRDSISKGLEHIVNLVSYRMSYSYFRKSIIDMFSNLGIRVKISPIRCIINGRSKIVKARVVPL